MVVENPKDCKGNRIELNDYVIFYVEYPVFEGELYGRVGWDASCGQIIIDHGSWSQPFSQIDIYFSQLQIFARNFDADTDELFSHADVRRNQLQMYKPKFDVVADDKLWDEVLENKGVVPEEKIEYYRERCYR